MLISVFPSHEGCCGAGHDMDFKVEEKRREAVEDILTGICLCQLPWAGAEWKTANKPEACLQPHKPEDLSSTPRARL